MGNKKGYRTIALGDYSFSKYRAIDPTVMSDRDVPLRVFELWHGEKHSVADLTLRKVDDYEWRTLVWKLKLQFCRARLKYILRMIL